MIWTLVIFLCSQGCTSQQIRMPSMEVCNLTRDAYIEKWKKLPVIADISCVAEAK